MDSMWDHPLKSNEIKVGTVHIWRGRLSTGLQHLPQIACCLSTDEKKKAARFHQAKDEQRYLFSHSMLRMVLAKYLNCKSESIFYKQDFYGKPMLGFHNLKEDIYFNMSHSEDLVIVALSRDQDVGVDVEFIRKVKDAQGIVKSSFVIQEQIHLFSLPSTEFINGFFLCWTLKEAFIKAIGKGLSYPMNYFSVIDSRGNISGIGSLVITSGMAREWYQLSFIPQSSYVGAMVSSNRQPKVLYFDFNTYMKNS